MSKNLLHVFIIIFFIIKNSPWRTHLTSQKKDEAKDKIC